MQLTSVLAGWLAGQLAVAMSVPVSMPMGDNDQGFTIQQYPGVPSKQFKGDLEVTYSEGQINGYRWGALRHTQGIPCPVEGRLLARRWSRVCACHARRERTPP